ncbi:MAG: hypothetical protein AB4057_09495 [Crocosphaera sp.]
MPRTESEIEKNQRADRIREAIDALKREISEIEASGWIAPRDCYIARYRAKGAKYRYQPFGRGRRQEAGGRRENSLR